jgi:hypothetical protein
MASRAEVTRVFTAVYGQAAPSLLARMSAEKASALADRMVSAGKVPARPKRTADTS